MDLITFFNSLTATVYGFITLFTWVAVQAIKQTKIDNHWLPLVSIIVGMLVGCVAAGYIYSTDIWLGGAFGFISGFAATGLNEVLNHYAFNPMKEGDK
ncbi:phage holin family protein [Leuconostoc gasicomitatum]|uniref:phage holin family protein n=1 Tax=Leuconostoc gasicomitatum TaxID=115778 RepID=UPI001CC71713|nr:phage holin family protein [Leuconostoc gasicomitatum]MBZ5998547.1 holin [Leuconostoc gasicomitatum]